MSVRVNLLPRDVEDRERARRARGLLVLAGLAFVGILVALYFVQVSRVNRAQDELDAAIERRDAVRAEVAALAEYEDLEERRDAALEVVQTAMIGDVSLAGVLQDVAAVMPNEAALTTLTVDFQVAGETGGDEDAEAGTGARPSFGSISGTGDTLRGHAPGVERFLLEFDKVAAFFNVFLTSSVVDEQEITVFSFEADLGPEILTARYLDGLPEALR